MDLIRGCKVFLVVFFFCTVLVAQERSVVLKTQAGDIHGSLLMASDPNAPVVLIIAGSGPTDRNGNQKGMENNSLKLLADSLNKCGIASLRYDKRGVGESKAAGQSERDLRFHDFVQDAKGWTEFLANEKKFSKIIVAGHSEGSLIGMVASQHSKSVDGFISIAGPGRPADEIIKAQIASQPEQIRNMVYPMLDTIKRGDTLTNVPPMLYAFFRPSVQPYMISWFQYDPKAEVAKLNIPVLILQGTTDIQVPVKDAEILKSACPKANLQIIPGMNHVLKEVPTEDRKVQIAAYSNRELPLHAALAKELVAFIKGIETK